MKKGMIALGLVTIMLFGISYVYAQEQSDPPSHGRMHGEKSWGPGKGLNLSSEQKAKFQELRRRFIKDTAQLRGELVTKKLELRLLWTDPKADSQAILAKEREFSDLKNRMKDKIIQYKLEFRSFLTPEQIGKLGKMGRRNFGHGSGMGHGRGMSHYGIWQ